MKNTKKIIFIIGKSRSGKDTIAKILKKEHGYEPIVSYATRPIRANETDGIEHHFITEEKMKEIKEKGKMIAYTKNDKTGYEYCATTSDLYPDKFYTYIINPEGFRYFLANNDISDIFYYTIFVDCSEESLFKRGKERKEKEDVFKKRIESEREEFDYFRDNQSSYIDYFFNTDIVSKDEMSDAVYEIASDIELEYKSFTVRGKQTIMHPKFEVGDKVYVHNINGTKTFEEATIIKKINTLTGLPMYVIDSYENTTITVYDMYGYNELTKRRILKYKIDLFFSDDERFKKFMWDLVGWTIITLIIIMLGKITYVKGFEYCLKCIWDLIKYFLIGYFGLGLLSGILFIFMQIYFKCKEKKNKSENHQTDIQN